MRIARGFAAITGPIPLLLLPKCPLCLLPLLAALGIAAPPGLVLHGAVGVVMAGWIALLMSATKSIALRAGGLVPAAIFIAGRALDLTPATPAAALAMVVLGFVVSRRCATSACAKKGQRCPQLSNKAVPCSDAPPITNASPRPPSLPRSSMPSVP